VELVDLEERAAWPHAREEPGGPLAYANRIAGDQFTVDRLLEDLAEQLDHRVDRRVGQRPAPTLICPPAFVAHSLHQERF
jgi:hypothetical protein